MVLLGIISDVHANLEALNAVLTELSRAKVDIIISVGDIVGYYPFPNETIDIFKKYNIKSIYGNHDKGVITRDLSLFDHYAKVAIEWTINTITHENLEYLKSLKAKDFFLIDGMRILVVHGSVSNENDYIYPKDLYPNILRNNDVDVIILGHTHIQFIVEFDEGFIFNPGSVGQPRDNNPLSAYAIFDTTSKDIKLRRTKYNINKMIQHINYANLPKELGFRLKSGK